MVRVGRVCLICPGTRQNFAENGGVCGVCVAISGGFCEVMDGRAVDSSYARMDSRGRLSLHGSGGTNASVASAAWLHEVKKPDFRDIGFYILYGVAFGW